MATVSSNDFWKKLLEITDALGDVKVQIATCSSNIAAQADLLAVLSGHQRDANGNASNILLRLVALELANAQDSGEKTGARRQWVIIGGVATLLIATAAMIGMFAGLVIQ